jgi:cell division protein FtsW (lipid II flippase)
MATVSRLRTQRFPSARLLTARRPRREHTSDYLWILGIVITLSLFGLLMVLSASSVTALYEHGNSWYEVGRQAMWFVIALIVLWFVQRFV